MKVNVDIWSDIMCPFCYIGKRRFEDALSQFEHKEEVKVTWHSFQLDPSIKPQPGKSAIDYLAERKGQSREWSMQMHENVTQMAKEAGLTYNFDKAVVANSFDAHRLIHLAQENGLGDAAEERLFTAYFTEGKDIADPRTLVELGKEIGLAEATVHSVIGSRAFAEEVEFDFYKAQILGIRGVPFFLFNDKYGISGAQSSATFLQVLQQMWDMKSPSDSSDRQDADSCNIDEKNC